MAELSVKFAVVLCLVCEAYCTVKQLASFFASFVINFASFNWVTLDGVWILHVDDLIPYQHVQIHECSIYW